MSDGRAASEARDAPGRPVPARYALVVAAGTGSRFGSDKPKQYATLGGRPLLGQTIDALARGAEPERIFVVLAPDDRWYVGQLGALPGVEPLWCGGATRARSVRNGLDVIATHAADADWVLVHDAARPCVSVGVLRRLVTELEDEPAGGLLAMPLADTLKRADESGLRCTRTEPRGGLWQAQTPQMFRFALLRRALAQADLDAVTDEAQAVEALGVKPRLVAGEASNIKITRADDLALAEAILAWRAATR